MSATPKAAPSSKADRLTKSDWIDHGLRALARRGPAALKVGPLAEALKVSRGSFYWHFRDIADFRAQLLAAWRERSVDNVIRDLTTQAEPDRLKYLMRRAFSIKLILERAVRAWAVEDKEAAAAVEAVDAGRAAYIAGLLTAAGVEEGRAVARARFIYWAYLGQAVVADARHAALSLGALDDISDLFEG